MEESAQEARLIAGRYRLGALLGRGAHGRVFEANDELTKQSVAVKLLERAAGTTAVRVRAEVDALRSLRLPGVVQLLDEGLDGDIAFLVMERARGTPFPGRRGPRAWAEIVGVTVSLLETLARVHLAGVVHRDIKPANVLVDGERALVLDFGLSFVGLEAESSTREVVGTPAYLAPEQFSGEPPAPTADLYAVGVMLYEALSGRLPHEAKGLIPLMRERFARRPDRLDAIVSSVPMVVADLVEQLLRLDPRERPRSAAAVLSCLRAESSSERVELPRLGPTTTRDGIIASLLRGHSVDVVGSRGSGRTRLSQEVADALEASGRTVVRATSSASVRERLALTAHDHVPPEPTSGEWRAWAATRARSALGLDAILVVDDAHRLDDPAAELVTLLREERAVLRVLDVARDEPGEIVALTGLDADDLLPLFKGPDRLLHLATDGARALWKRTRGVPAALVAEVAAWGRAGLCRWDGRSFVIERATLDRLEVGVRVAPLFDARSDGQSDSMSRLDDRRRDLIGWIAVARPNASVALLSSLLGRSPEELEVDVRQLCDLGAIVSLGDDLLDIHDSYAAAACWSWQRRASAHRLIAGCLEAGAQGRLAHLFAGAHDGDQPWAREIGREAELVAQRLARSGHLGRAVAVLEESFRHVRRVAPASLEEQDALLATWAEIALAEGTPRPIERLLYAVCRVDPSTPFTAQLDALLRAALAVGAWTDRALDMVEAVPPMRDARLERQRQGLRVAAARRSNIDRERHVVDQVVCWAEQSSDPSAAASLAAWLGRLRYREGRFEEAVALQDHAAASEQWVTAKMAALLNASSAMLELFRLQEAAERALAARDLARSCRHPFAEGRAEWLLRCSRYRAGDDLAPDLAPDLAFVEAVASIRSPELEGYVYLNEAAIAWRRGESSVCLELARCAHDRWARMGDAPAALLAAGLMIASGEAPTGWPLERVESAALRCPLPAVSVQVLGLLAPFALGPTTAAHVVDKLLPQVARKHWDRRREVLSIDEALARLGLSSAPSVALTAQPEPGRG